MSSVTQTDVYNAIQDLRREVLTEVKEIRKDVEDLKDFRSRLWGIVSVFGVFVSLAATYIWQKIFGMEK